MGKFIRIVGVFSVACVLCSMVFQRQWSDLLVANAPVYDVLFDLGVMKPAHFIEQMATLSKQGEELIKIGRTTDPNGKQGKFISKFYTCTSCHNLVREDPDLRIVDQESRLSYAIEKNIAYLQGSTFWGMVNRETWYNDDYVLKYGDLVRKAEHSLEESIQLCAQVCSQGRPLEDWEMKSILSYLWSLQLDMDDLNMDVEELKSLNTLTNDSKVQLIKSKYLNKSPATFVDPPADKHMGYGLVGNPDRGKAIFELGCQHCHRPNGESDVVFEKNALTLNWLSRHMYDDGDKSIYEIVRKGTYAASGHKEYMPHYTLEKMSHQQVEDLRAYIQQ
jgi:mono/diheme cytochrome c family protein